MTTDSVPKQASFADEGWSIGGMAKGAGMLAPGLATMLVIPPPMRSSIKACFMISYERLPG